MKPILVLQMVLVHLMFLALVASVSADEGKNKDPTAYALIPAYLMAALLSFIFTAWALWRIIHNWGSWKIHVPSPRPQYLRESFGWVNRETWELKQAKLAKRKETKRDNHNFYRTTKANYKWIFHDPTGELQQRFDDQKKRSYLRLLPSWMRSYPHGTLQSGVFVEQVKPPRDIYQLPELFSTHSRLSVSESLESAQLDPYRLLMGYHDAIMPSALGKSCLLTKLPMMDEPNVIQVWRVRPTPLPELLGRPRLESEQELDGEVETQETAIRRDTEYRLTMGRPQETTNDFGSELRVEGELPLLPIFTTPIPRHPPVFSRRLMRDHPGPEAERLAVVRRRRQRYIENIESRIREVRADPTLMMVPGVLENLIQELHQARGVRHRQAPIVSRPPVQDPPVPENVRQANRIQRYIEDLERRIHDLHTEPTLITVHGTIDSLMHELRGARASRDRLVPPTNLPPAVPTSQDELQNNEMSRLGVTVQGSDTVGALNAVNRLHHLANENFQNHLRNLQNSSDVQDVQAFIMTVDTFRSLFQGLTIVRANLASTANLGTAQPIAQRLLRDIQNINASTPTIITPRTHREANRAVIEGPGMDGNTSSDPTTEEEEVYGRGDRAVNEGREAGDTSRPNPISEEEIRPDTQHPIAAALLRSVPDHDALLDQAGPVAPHHFESEDAILAEATHHTAAFYTEMGRSDSAPDVHVQDVQTEHAATPTNTLHSPSSSTATLPSPAAIAVQATTTATLVSPDLEDALDEELYTDAYP